MHTHTHTRYQYRRWPGNTRNHTIPHRIVYTIYHLPYEYTIPADIDIALHVNRFPLAENESRAQPLLYVALFQLRSSSLAGDLFAPGFGSPYQASDLLQTRL